MRLSALSFLRRALLFSLLLVPLACLLLRWPALPARVPLHFSQAGADHYGDKAALLA